MIRSALMKKAFIITAVILAVSLCVSAGVVLFGDR